tara:strand:- start:195 stop:311 length:117 start_codon:yes stop_codon:yes gene_type:complete
MYALERSQNSMVAERKLDSTKESGQKGTYGNTSLTKEE